MDATYLQTDFQTIYLSQYIASWSWDPPARITMTRLSIMQSSPRKHSYNTIVTPLWSGPAPIA
jgi:hypothetical protein